MAQIQQRQRTQAQAQAQQARMAQQASQDTQATPAAERAERAERLEDVDAHALPGWVNFIQDNLFLSFLILAEAYLLGTLMTLGWVADIEAPSRWGDYHAVGVVLFFLAGAMAAGVALRCSVKAAACFTRHEWGMALFNFVGLLLFSSAEIWASLSERSANLRPTPADAAVLNLLGVGHAPISPTVVVVAFLLPFASLYYGFSQQHRRDSAAERAAKAAQEDFALERKLKQAQATAQIRAAQVAGMAGAFKAGVGALRGDPVAQPTQAPAGDSVAPANSGEEVNAAPASPLALRWSRQPGQRPPSGS